MKNIIKPGLVLPAALLAMAFTVMGPPPQKEDSYKVIKVNGSITVKKTGKQLVQGDIFQENTTLDFVGDAKATVINAEKGRFILAPKTASSRSNLIPAINNISSRSGAIINIIDLQNFFKGDVCVIDRSAIKIASKEYSMSKDNFFYLEYSYKGEKINKKMSYVGDSLVIDRAELYKVDGVEISSPDTKAVTLYYRNSKENKSYNISTFNLIFPDGDELKKEVNIILDEIKAKPNANKVDEVMSYLTEFYGKPSKDNVMDWMKKHYKI